MLCSLLLNVSLLLVMTTGYSDWWFLVTSPTVSTDLQLFTLASNLPSSEESNAEDGTSEKLTGLAILSPQSVPFADSCQQHQRWGIIPAFLWCYAESSPPFHSTRLPPNVYSVFGWGVPRFTEAVRGVWWSRHSWPSHRVTRCSSPASLGRTDQVSATYAAHAVRFTENSVRKTQNIKRYLYHETIKESSHLVGVTALNASLWNKKLSYH